MYVPFFRCRGLKSDGDSNSNREDSLQGDNDNVLHSSQESLLELNDESISSMDIDLGALEKV